MTYRTIQCDPSIGRRSTDRFWTAGTGDAYCIQVLANPEKRLKATDLDNNSALRKIVLGGEPGKRTVTGPAHDLVNAN
ncbi:hypothetical protein [Streptomyces sp. NPDC057002]|uniref:hypothetical protein n=1 Tax=Streptomyces sp. NPDC057002 TaxID=3345992 RepID=UPI0036345081